MEKMLVTQALNELKTLDNRIFKEITNANLVASAKTSDKKVTPTTTKEDFINKAKADYQSINDLINRRQAIKAAIVNSNANTYVEICGEKMSIAQVIELKYSIGYKESLLGSMKMKYSTAKSEMIRANSVVETKIDSLVSTAFGKESKANIKPEDYDSIATPYRNANEVSLVDPIKVEDEITKLENYIDEFKSNVDSILQISNCVTYIEF